MKNLTYLLIIVFLAACSSTGDKSSKMSASWLKDGSISISRPIPAATTPKTPQVLGFMPIQSKKQWIKINKEKSKISIMNGQKETLSYKANGVDSLKEGRYHIAMKQENSMWYANNEYFTKRNLKVPSKSSSERYLKSALGKYALFLDSDNIIHSSKMYDDSVKGAQMRTSDIEVLYSAFSADDLVIVE